MKTYLVLAVLFAVHVSIQAQTSDVFETQEAIMTLEEAPRFPGCERAELTKEEKESCAQTNLLKYIYSNISYPELARENGIEGQVVVQFIVNKRGELDNIDVVRGLEGGCSEEVLRVVRKMTELNGPWRPGYFEGQPVNVKYTLPIKFKLESGKKKKLFGKKLPGG